ncbi:MAG: hypothetical protein ACRD0J_04260, partial [Acidimicrobiales bacterium]
ALAAAAAVAVAGAAAGVAVTYPSTPAAPAVAPVAGGPISATNPTTGVTATTTLSSQPWGTAVRLVLVGVTPGQRCHLVAVARDGSSDVAGSWQASYAGQASVEGATAIPRAQLASLKVVTAGGTTLVTVPVANPAGAAGRR